MAQRDTMGAVTIADVNASIARAGGRAPKGGRQGDELLSALRAFVVQNEDPSRSPNLADESPDDLAPLIAVLSDPSLEENETLALQVLKALKVLSRKYENRVDFGQAGCEATVRLLKRIPGAAAGAEACNVVLNICYEKPNVEAVLNAGGLSALVMRLAEDDTDLRANAAGALQSITFQEKGRGMARDAGAVPLIVGLLDHRNEKIRTRAVGALHNISSDDESIRIIRRQGGIPLLVDMLGAPQPSICSSAVGTLQNVSREVQSSHQILELEGVGPLSDLLFATDVQAQVAAAGALLNIFGHPTEDEAELTAEAALENIAAPSRQAMRKLLSSSLTLGMAYSGVGWADACQPT